MTPREAGQYLANSHMKGLSEIPFTKPPMLEGLQLHRAEELLGHSPLTQAEFEEVLRGFQNTWRKQLDR